MMPRNKIAVGKKIIEGNFAFERNLKFPFIFS